MNEKLTIEKTLKNLSNKIKTTNESKELLEKNYVLQKNLFIDLIENFSFGYKGINNEINLHLLSLIQSLKSSNDIKLMAEVIETFVHLFKKSSVKQHKDLRLIKEQIKLAVYSLEKIPPCSNDIVNSIQELITQVNNPHSDLIACFSLYNDVVRLYEKHLTLDINKQSNSNQKLSYLEKLKTIEHSLIKRLQSNLEKLTLSETRKKNLSQLKANIAESNNNEQLFSQAIDLIELIISDINNERHHAKLLLSNINHTLTSFETNIISIISNNQSSDIDNDKLNTSIQNGLDNICIEINEAHSLSDLKNDVNKQLENIIQTLHKKTELEYEQRSHMKKKLNTMNEQVQTLEKQRLAFEDKIKDQQKQMLTDPLTKLNNRMAFNDFFAEKIEKNTANDTSLSIAIIDLDDFKKINDTYGHSAGDKTLQVIAETLSKILGKYAFLSRWGGEEFVVITDQLEHSSFIKKLNELRKSVAALHFSFKNNRVCVTLSVGVTSVSDIDTVDTAFERADNALYQAKTSGKNKVIFSE